LVALEFKVDGWRGDEKEGRAVMRGDYTQDL
jgi:hypothetical protein